MCSDKFLFVLTNSCGCLWVFMDPYVFFFDSEKFLRVLINPYVTFLVRIGPYRS